MLLYKKREHTLKLFALILLKMEMLIVTRRQIKIAVLIISCLVILYALFLYRTRTNCVYRIFDYEVSNPSFVVYQNTSDSRRSIISATPIYEIHLDSQINKVSIPLELGFADFKFYRKTPEGIWVELSDELIRDSIRSQVIVKNGGGITSFQFRQISPIEDLNSIKLIDSLSRNLTK